ncbi:hypothetical protein [Paenibacillus lutimineralis]|uniref:Uncharacterized protein n=1 Tax=Paenibacillus lutimineralis TaxID=2707005 RepID=A0A3Q9IC59_9BACL|nr:hypothetical protein [Paenibacillus lutimineralis]AZS17377.1 hypothetical protein EI981_25120 [Paenibacillus lutimineralis]
MTNEQYCKTMTGNAKMINKMLMVMDKYGENRWWLSDDTKRMCYFQLQEDSLLIEWEAFHRGVELLLGRRVETVEFSMTKMLFEEAKQKYKPA